MLNVQSLKFKESRQLAVAVGRSFNLFKVESTLKSKFQLLFNKIQFA